jgi:hypothetical protein
MHRRHFLQSSLAAASAVLPRWSLGDEFEVSPRHDGPRPKIAAIYTELREFSHAYHILEAHMAPFLFNGKLVDPGVDVVSWYADQFSEEGDMTREAAERLQMPLFDTIEGALTLGGDELAVDGVLLIGEHGNYPRTELGVIKYPRKEFFDATLAVMDRSQKYVPIFNDKHLSYRWDWAKEMYDTCIDRGIPFMAGSSVPLAHRIPDLGLPGDTEVIEAVSIHGGPLEVYDIHGMEVLQSIVEKRRGGEVGIKSIQTLEGDALLAAANEGRWSLGLAMTAMKQEPGTFRDFSEESETALRHGVLVEYADGCRGTVLAVGNSGERWNFACQIAGRDEPLAWRYNPGPWGNRNLFRALSYAIQRLFITRHAPYPVERTLLATGVVETAVLSHHQGGEKIETPHLMIPYAHVDYDDLRERGASWDILQPDTPQPERFEPGDAKTLRLIRGM